jgi:D-serine deaminase-like pyridoxal phosphate-dependent protein
MVASYLRRMASLHRTLVARGLYDEELVPVVSAGGSAYFDVVSDVLGPLGAEGAQVVLRSGAYLAHDDGVYRSVSPLGSEPRTSGRRLTSAMHGWVRVSSQPEPGLAIFDAGKRDLPFDEGLPEVHLRRARPGEADATTLIGTTVTAFNDQHGFLSFADGTPPLVAVGDRLRLGLSHPCTAFDKWGLIPVVDDADGADPLVVDVIRTFF